MPGDSPPLFDLSDRVALVTGGSRGIGAALAKGLADAGAHVVAVSRTGGSAATRLSHEVCDVSDATSRSALFQRLARMTDRLHVLVNAAAISLAPGEPGDDAYEITRLRNTLDANVVASYAMILGVRALLRSARGASIINITSINSVRGFPHNPGYVASKAALAGLTRALAVDLAVDHIRVNAIAPGYVHTAMTEASYSDPKLNAQRSRHTILGRWGEPQDIVGAAVFLASNAAAYVTGQEIFVDGGWTANGLLMMA